MTFLNPAILFGLVAIAIPVVLHLLNLRRLRTVEFSTLVFLKELHKTKMRRLKLRQILLLILRTAMIALLVVAFARPALRGSALPGIGTQAKTTMILLLDDSFSMSASDERGSLFNQAKAVAINLLSLVKEGDEVYLQKFSEGIPDDGGETPTHDVAAVRSAIEETKISMTYHSLDKILSRASNVLGNSRNIGKEIYLITDLQKTTFADEGGKIGVQRGEVSPPNLREKPTQQARLYLLPLGKRVSPNAAVEAIDIKTRIFEKGRPFSLEARIRNSGDAPLRNATVSLYLDGARVMQKSVDIPPDGSATVDFNAIPKRTGHIDGYIQIEPDAIDQDNQRFFTIFVPEKIKILFVTDSPSDISFLNLALTSDETTRASFDIQRIAPTKLLMTPFTESDVIVFSNVRALLAPQVQRLKQYLLEGGGVILFPGDEFDWKQYNGEFCQLLEIAQYMGKIGSDAGQSSFVTFETIDLEHPLFFGIFEAKTFGKTSPRKSVESPQIRTTLEYHPNAKGRSIIQLSNGTSFLTEYKIGNGRILLYSVSPTLDWSDFPLKGIFVPIVRRSVSYLASWTAIEEEHFAGMPVTIMLPSKVFRFGEGTGVVHRSPSGEDETLQPLTSEVRAAERVFRIKNTDVSGIHDVFREKEVVASFAVNVDPRESDLRKLTPEDAVRWLTEYGFRPDAIETIDPDRDVQSVIYHSRFGVELWKYFIGLAFFCALLELILGRDKKEKSQLRED